MGQGDALSALAFAVECWLARRHARLQSRRSDARLIDFLALSRQHMWECDDQLAITWCSTQHSEDMSRAASAIHQMIRSDAKLLDPDGRLLPTGDTLSTLLLRRQPYWRCVVRGEDSGTVRFIEISGVSLWSSTGRFLGHRGLVTNRTDWIRSGRTRDTDLAPGLPIALPAVPQPSRGGALQGKPRSAA